MNCYLEEVDRAWVDELDPCDPRSAGVKRVDDHAGLDWVERSAVGLEVKTVILCDSVFPVDPFAYRAADGIRSISLCAARPSAASETQLRPAQSRSMILCKSSARVADVSPTRLQCERQRGLS